MLGGQGGVSEPVLGAVFKTVGGRLSGVLGGFDSHTPLPASELCSGGTVILLFGFAVLAKLCFLFSWQNYASVLLTSSFHVKRTQINKGPQNILFLSAKLCLLPPLSGRRLFMLD